MIFKHVTRAASLREAEPPNGSNAPYDGETGVVALDLPDRGYSSLGRVPPLGVARR